MSNKMNYLGTTPLREHMTSGLAAAPAPAETESDKMRLKICLLEKEMTNLRMWNFYIIIAVLSLALFISILLNIVHAAKF